MHLKTLEKELLSRSLPERIQFIASYFAGERLVFSTSFGQEDQAITQAIASTKSAIEIFTLDTGRQFQESYELMDLTIKKYGISLQTFFPNTSAVETLVAEKGFNSFYTSVENRKECCFVRKMEPLNRALQGAKVWITGLRAEQSDNRNNLAVFDPKIAEVQVIHGSNRAGDIPHSLASIEKAKNKLGYNPKFSIEAGIKEAVSWYFQNLK